MTAQRTHGLENLIALIGNPFAPMFPVTMTFADFGGALRHRGSPTVFAQFC